MVKLTSRIYFISGDYEIIFAVAFIAVAKNVCYYNNSPPKMGEEEENN